jgi:hypothetical protein
LRVFGNAGSGKAWHHIVQQTATNVNRFGAQAIHNARNIVRISHGGKANFVTETSKAANHWNELGRGEDLDKWMVQLHEYLKIV